MNTQTASEAATVTNTTVTPAPKKEAKKTKAPKAKEAKVETAKEPKVKKVKLIGPFADYALKALEKKEDKKNPMSFKTWAKKHAPNYDNDSTEALVQFRAAYDEDMAAALRLKQDKKMAKEFDKDFKTIINFRSTRMNDLNGAMRRLYKAGLINGYRLELALATSVKEKKSIIFEIGYSVHGLAVVQASKRKKALMDLYRVRTTA